MIAVFKIHKIGPTSSGAN